MSSTRLSLLIMLSLSAMACANHPDIAGKVSIVLDDETLILDTGGDGKRFAKTGEDWSTSCYKEYGALSMLLERAPGGHPPVKMIALHVINKDDDGDPAPNVVAELKKDLYAGFCDVVATVGSDPHDVKFSAGDCDLQRVYDGYPAWLVSASFRVKECEN